jgi:hypothetical protein
MESLSFKMKGRNPTRKEAKKAEADANLVRLRAILNEAHAAAGAAFSEFMKSAPLSPDGLVIDVCGWYSVIVFKPSYQFREGMKRLGEIERDYDGAWHISNFTKHINQQSITAHRVACEAACAVLKQRCPGQGEFFARGRID